MLCIISSCNLYRANNYKWEFIDLKLIRAKSHWKIGGMEEKDGWKRIDDKWSAIDYLLLYFRTLLFISDSNLCRWKFVEIELFRMVNKNFSKTFRTDTCSRFVFNLQVFHSNRKIVEWIVSIFSFVVVWIKKKFCLFSVV